MKKILIISALLVSFLGTAQIIFPIGGSPNFGNTDAQQLSLSGNTLTLQNGGTVNLAPYLDNTDGQTITNLSLSGNILSITLSGGNTATVDLSTISGSGGGASAFSELTGTIANNQVPESAVTQHEAALSISTAQLVGTIGTGNLANNSVTGTKIAPGTVEETDLNASTNASLDLADSALQSGDNISELTNDSGYITSQTDDQTASEVTVAPITGLSGANVQEYLADMYAKKMNQSNTIRLANNPLTDDYVWTVVRNNDIKSNLAIQTEQEGNPGTNITRYTLNYDGSPTIGTDLIDLDYFNANVGGGSNNDVFTGQELTDGYTLTSNDFDTGRKIFWYDGATDIEINLTTDVATTGEKVILWQYGTGKIQVNKDAALNGISFSTTDSINPVTLTKQFDVFGYRPIGNWEDYSPTPPITSLYGLNDPLAIGANESNSIAGFSDSEYSFTLLNSGSGTPPINGDYAILAQITSGGGAFTTFDIPSGFTTTSGNTYRITIRVKEISGTTWNAQLSVSRGWTSTTFPTVTSDGTWEVWTLEGVSNATNSRLRIYNDSDANGSQLAFDYIIIEDLGAL